jgi:acetyl-CoA carboxylase biotin carboxylase subunit
MNTRLQVEHPVTELVTGLDLVHLQIHVASGGKLPFTQADVKLRGHAMECRIYAEDPDNNFFPSPGEITRLLQPSGPGIREDCGVYEGWHVPLDYDPMLSKLIAYAPTREQAIARLQRALEEYFIGGIKTNLGLFRRILANEDFRTGRMDTGMLDRMLATKAQTTAADSSPDDLRAAAIAAAFFAYTNGVSKNGAGNSGTAAPENGKWRSAARREALRASEVRG